MKASRDMDQDASHALLSRVDSVGLDEPLATSLVDLADRRLRESLRVIGALTGLPVLIVIVVLAAGDFTLRGLWALAVAGAVSAGLAFAASAPARQERAFTRRLVRQGRIAKAVVTGQGQYLNGQPTLDVALGTEGRSLRFRLPVALEEVQATVGLVLPALVLDDDPDVVGILVPGFGLVTTR